MAKVKKISVDEVKSTISIGAKKTVIARKPLSLAKLFLSNEGVLLERDRVLTEIWGRTDSFTASSMDVYVNNLRRMIEGSGFEIICVKKKGHIFKRKEA